ncbi:redox-sensing transcriptional repressor Rex, partial [Planctomycetota bacterium]
MRLKALNFVRVFSENLADAAGVSATQVRKDFSIFGVTGNRRGGYKVDELITQLNKILGKDKVRRFVLVGMGNLGRTLVRYGGFETSGIKIVAGFDIDAAQYNEEGNIPILPLERITDYIGNQNIEFAIIAVP